MCVKSMEAFPYHSPPGICIHRVPMMGKLNGPGISEKGRAVSKARWGGQPVADCALEPAVSCITVDVTCCVCPVSGDMSWATLHEKERNQA